MNIKAPLSLLGTVAMVLGVSAFAFGQQYPQTPPPSTAHAPIYSTANAPMTSTTNSPMYGTSSMPMHSPSMMTMNKPGSMHTMQGKMHGKKVMLSKSQIKKLQRSLKDKGYYLKVDGIWGQNTVDDLKDVQFKNNLDVTGRPDKDTLRALGLDAEEFGMKQSRQYSNTSRWDDNTMDSNDSSNDSSPMPMTQSSGSKSNMRGKMNNPVQLSQKQIRTIQRKLSEAGFEVDATGHWNQKTHNALVKFQKKNGLNVTGYPDKATRQALGVTDSMWGFWATYNTTRPR